MKNKVLCPHYPLVSPSQNSASHDFFEQGAKERTDQVETNIVHDNLPE